MAYAYLVDPQIQFQTKSGTLNVAGTLRVYDAATDDVVITYKDFNGTENEASIRLDNNGRAIVIADADKVYRLEVYDRYGSLFWTVSPLWCIGTGGGGIDVHGTDIISTDGSLVVAKTEVGSQTVFDLGIAPQSDEFLEWMDSDPVTVTDGDNVPDMTDGTMTETGSGVAVYKDRFYHVTNSFTVTPTGSGIAYDTLTVSLMFTDGNTPVTLVTRAWDIDNSLTDPVECEFSYDVKPSADGYLYWTISGASAFSSVSGQMQIHRIYSGVNAVPDTCATKQWVSANYQPQSSMSSYVQYSALEYNPSSQITAISGSAIGGMVDPNDFIPWSASSQFQPSGSYQPSGDYVYESAYSAFSSNVTNNISSLSSSVTGLSADMSAYLPLSGLQGDGTSITAIEGSAIGGTASGGKTYSGVSPIIVDNTADTISIQQLTLTVDSSMTSYYSGDSAVLGVNTTAIGSAIASGKLDASASSLFYPMDNPSGYITGVDLSNYATTADVASSVSSKLDASASGDFVQNSSMSSYMPFSSLESDGTSITAIDGSAIGSPVGPQVVTATGSAETAGSSYITSINGLPVSAKTASFAGAATYAYLDGYGEPLDQSANQKVSAMTAYQTVADMSAYQASGDYAYNSSLSAKLDASASSDFYSTSNPSGFITGVDLTPYQTTAGMTAYQPVGAYIYESALGWAEV